MSILDEGQQPVPVDCPPLAALGLGPRANPSLPFSWGWHQLTGPGPGGDPVVLHILVLETAVGRIFLPLNDGDLTQLIRSAEMELTGLVLPGGPA